MCGLTLDRDTSFCVQCKGTILSTLFRRNAGNYAAKCICYTQRINSILYVPKYRLVRRYK